MKTLIILFNKALYILIPLCFFGTSYLAAVFASNEWDMFKWVFEVKFPFAMGTIMFMGFGVIFAYMINNDKN